MNVILQKNTSPINKMGKSVETIATLNGTLKNESEIINPHILIEASESDIKNSNYLTINEFGRKYFIEEIESIRERLWLIKAHVDVLDSFQSQIKANTAVISRQEHNFNLLLNDGVFKVKQNPLITYKNFPSGLGNFNYILITQGGTS